MSTDDDEEEELVGLPPLPSDAAAKKVVVAEQQTSPPQQAVVSNNNASSSSAVEEEATSYPIDLPSPILLATSMVLAISSIGKKKDALCIVVSNIINLFMHALSDYYRNYLLLCLWFSLCFVKQQQQQNYIKYCNTHETK